MRLIFRVTLYIGVDEGAQRLNFVALLNGEIQHIFSQLVANALPLKGNRHFGVREDNVGACQHILDEGHLMTKLDLKALLFFVLSDFELLNIDVHRLGLFSSKPIAQMCSITKWLLA